MYNLTIGFLEKNPFIRFLLSLLTGILFQYHYQLPSLKQPLLFTGLIIMLGSYFIPRSAEYRFRWLFGCGLFLFIVSVAIYSTNFRQNTSDFTFSDSKKNYSGIVIDSPKEKPKSIACEVKLDNGKKIMCYFQKGIRSRDIVVGNHLLFDGKIQQFRNFENATDFDYPKYMYNNGFSGTVYLRSSNWEATGEKVFSLNKISVECKQSILNFYKSLNLTPTEYSVLSALTLGYKDELPEDILQSFRATGTAHILAVSGMHVGIIYGAIFFLISFIFRKNRLKKITPLVVAILLWFYAFITGFSPSVTRAVIVLTIICIAQLRQTNNTLSYNNIAFAAFIMLLYNPFWLFNVSFQLSFAAILSICFFNPILYNSINIENAFLKPVWKLSSLTIAAQLGTFSICLHHFGTFPVYFFITNLLIVPLASIIFYAAFALLVIKLIVLIPPISNITILYEIPVFALKAAIGFIIKISSFFQTLPFAIINGAKISATTTILFIVFIYSISLFFMHKKAKLLIFSLGLILASVATNLITKIFY